MNLYEKIKQENLRVPVSFRMEFEQVEDLLTNAPVTLSLLYRHSDSDICKRREQKK